MLDVIRLAHKYHLPLQESGPRCRPGWVQLQCPQCGSGGTHGGWYLGFSLERGNFHCWRCGSVKFWVALEGLLGIHDKGQLLDIVKEHQKGGTTIAKQAITRLRRIEPPKGSGPLNQVHHKYLQKRGFDSHQLEEDYDLLGTRHTGDAWAWRIIIPVKNQEGRVVAYQGRSIGDAQPKYKFTEDAKCLEDPHTLIYGLDRIDGETIIIVEGVPGVWRIGPGAVATFGIDWKRPQANILRAIPRRFVLFDPEPAAQKRARQLAEYLCIFPGETTILEGFATDPGEFSLGKVLGLRKFTGLS